MYWFMFMFDEYVFMFRVGVVFELVLGFKSVGLMSVSVLVICVSCWWKV